ncbi:MAG TPA: hypothetical protein VMJ70_03300 [Candidatus Sulfotelmatobacter sp.]|nr:hypothetical protein [Candidatus Sulfotelmatobacter sp.]
MKRRFELGLLALLVIGPALAGSSRANATPTLDHVDGTLLDVRVIVDGTPAPLFLKPGNWDRDYFQAFKNKTYSLQITNNSGERVAALIAVDGLNVVNGQHTRLANNEAMYVLGPYQTATIRGWRTSLSDVRSFVFVDEERSYASRTDQANGDMGWIRVLSFREQPQRVTWRDDQRGQKERSELQGGGPSPSDESGSRAKAAPAPTAQSPESGDLRADRQSDESRGAPRNDAAPGTGWGDHRYDPVQRTEFMAAAYPTDQLVLRYEYASGLRALGIFPRQPRVWERERGELGFAQPPRW